MEPTGLGRREPESSGLTHSWELVKNSLSAAKDVSTLLNW